MNATIQLTDNELEKMMTDNKLEIVWSPKKEKWVLNSKHGERSVFMKSCQFKTPLYWAVKKIDERRKAKLSLAKSL